MRSKLRTEQNLFYLCAKDLFIQKEKETFFRIVRKSRDYQNLFECLYQIILNSSFFHSFY